VDQIMTLRGDLELVARTGHLFERIQDEFACAARDLETWSQPEARAAVGARRHAIGKDFTIRKLLSPVALTTESSRDHLTSLSQNGAQVRITGTPLPHETIILDRRTMILAGPDSPTGREYTVTTSATLVGGVYALFDAAWQNATPYESYLTGAMPLVDTDARTILRALGEGLTDESAARRLGLSLRTYRRRVADLMRKLDADSRFQAGHRAAELGLH
jgi:DNA-binding CsgD family transcriptional regulator